MQANTPPNLCRSGPHWIFLFLTCAPNGVVPPIHPEVMPVVLSPAEALALQKPPPDDEMVLQEREWRTRPMEKSEIHAHGPGPTTRLVTITVILVPDPIRIVGGIARPRSTTRFVTPLALRCTPSAIAASTGSRVIAPMPP